MPDLISKERFDDVSDEDVNGWVDYAYHGYNYVIDVRGRRFKVRTYDHEPGVATVISPTSASRLPERAELVRFLENSIGCSRFAFYQEATGCYAEFDKLNDKPLDPPELRAALRYLLGLLGAIFIGVATFVIVWRAVEPRSETPAAISGLLGGLLGFTLVAIGAYARSASLRMLAWGLAGAGFGNLLMAIIRGGLPVGTWLTLSGIVMAIVGAVLGYRTNPPRAKNEVLDTRR